MVILTNRERQCLYLAAKGKTSLQMAAILGIKERTVNFHINNTLSKLLVKKRQAAIAVAIKKDLFKYLDTKKLDKKCNQLQRKTILQKTLKKPARSPRPRIIRSFKRRIKISTF